MPDPIRNALQLALEEAKKFQGATCPNPPVGAVGLNAQGEVLCIAAHEKAGTFHAEFKVIQTLEKQGLLSQLHTLVITLEPCNHQGRTPPCTEAILKAKSEGGLQKVFFGCPDPNPKVTGQGAQFLRQAGLSVIPLEDPQSIALIQPFSHWIQTGRPWVTLKTAYTAHGSMIPPPGQKTFSSPSALKFAHELRRISDAILTGSGTVLADHPEFTVRHCADHPDKKRWLIVLDRRQRTPQSWIHEREKTGFRVQLSEDADEALDFLGSQGVLEVLVEAGPILSSVFLSRSLWNRHVVITPEGIDIRLCSPASFKKKEKSAFLSGCQTPEHPGST